MSQIFFSGLRTNFKTRRALTQAFKDNYDVFCRRFERNFNIRYLVEYSFGYFCNWEDYHGTIKFFKDRDTSKYDLALSQVLEGIRIKIGYVEHSTGDLVDWLDGRRKTTVVVT